MSELENVDEISLGEESEFSGFEAEVVDSPPTPKLTRSKVKAKPSANKDVVVDPSTSGKEQKANPTGSSKKGKKMKSVAFRVNKSPSKMSKTAGKSSVGPGKSSLDVSKLSRSDILALKQKLDALQEFEQGQEMVDENLGPLEMLPNIQVALDPNDISDGDVDLDYGQAGEHIEGLNADLGDVLFGDGPQNEYSDPYDAWPMPKLKAPERGPDIQPSLAKLINTSCTVQCDTDSIIGKYKTPQNCECLGAPSVNEKIFKVLPPRARSQDEYMKEVQNLLSVGMVPVIKLANILKPQIQENKEVKELMADLITIVGQTQHLLSIRRRYMIRPYLNRKYTNLCNMKTPVSKQLFGDDIDKDIKDCSSDVYLGRGMFGFRGRRGRGRRGGGYPYDQGYSSRFAPYPRGRPYSRGQNARVFNQRGRRVPTATVTSESLKN